MEKFPTSFSLKLKEIPRIRLKCRLITAHDTIPIFSSKQAYDSFTDQSKEILFRFKVFVAITRSASKSWSKQDTDIF